MSTPATLGVPTGRGNEFVGNPLTAASEYRERDSGLLLNLTLLRKLQSFVLKIVFRYIIG
jgi:hypothetical protein